jgi:PmbA protein
METNSRLELAHWVAQAAKAAGADDAKVDITNSRQVEVEFRDGQLDNLKESTQNSLNLNIYADNKYTGHSTNDLRKDSLGRFVRDAVAMTKFLSEDLFRQLPDPKYYRGMSEVQLDLIDPAYGDVTADQRVAVAKELYELVASKSDKIISSTAGYYDSFSESVKVHTNGFEGLTAGTSFSVGAEVTIDDGSGGRPSDWDYATCRHRSDLPQAATQAAAAVERALAQIGQTKIESGVRDMVIHNRSAWRPIVSIQGPMGGRAIQQKRSFLDGMVGKKVGSELMTFVDDPFIPRGHNSRHYDDEGMSTRKRTLVDKGVLTEYLIDCYYGRKLEMDPTGGSVSNLVIPPGDKSLEEMIASVENGILVNSFNGGNSNGTTGDYSWGISGMLIENGKIIKPVNEMNISGNLIELWSNLVAVGNDPYPYSSLRRPSLHFANVEFSGI